MESLGDLTLPPPLPRLVDLLPSAACGSALHSASRSQGWVNLKASTVWLFIIKGWCCHSRRRCEWQHHASTYLLFPLPRHPSPALWFGRSTPPAARPRRLPAALSRCRLLARALAARLPAPPASVRLLPAGLLLACPSAGPAPCPAPPPCRSSPALLPGVRSRLAIAHVTQGCLPHTWVALWVLAGREKSGCRALLVSVVLCGPIFLRVAPNLSWLRSGWWVGRGGWLVGWAPWGALVGGGRVGAGCLPSAQFAAWTLAVIRALPPLCCTLYSPSVVSAPAP